MTRRHALRLAALAATVSLGSVLAQTGHAQTVRVFEDAPSLEQLRSILIPESKPGGLSRRIELPRRETLAGESSVRPAAAEPAAPAQTGMRPTVTSRAEPEAAKSGVVAAPTSKTEAPVGTVMQSAAAPPQGTNATKAAERGEPEARVADAVGFRINFALNSAVVPPAYERHIDQIGELLRQEPDLKLLVEGHTDALGSDEYNLELSKRRALSVARYLVAHHGIEPERLQIAGKGKTEPLLDNAYDPGNRRVQFLRVK
jgi:outer membrane protein OmpA-like peptidoglycan-associated protein